MLLKISISFFLFLLIFTLNLKAKENWVLDRNLSSIEFELPVLLLKNVKGKFTDIEGLVEIDIDSKKNNKAIFSVSIKSIDMNYKKYKDLLLSKIFFNTEKHPIALIDTNKFSYNDEKTLELNVQLTIKGRTNIVPLKLEIKHFIHQIRALIMNVKNFFKSVKVKKREHPLKPC